MVRLCLSDLAIRHVTKPEDAKREKKQGVEHGDAVCLSKGIGTLLTHLSESKKLTMNERLIEDIQTRLVLVAYYEDSRNRMTDILESVPEEDKTNICAALEQSLLDFISSSYTIDTKIDDRELLWLEIWLSNLKTQTCFLLLHDENAVPRDVERYYHLGKIGKQEICRDRMLCRTKPLKNVDQIYNKAKDRFFGGKVKKYAQEKCLAYIQCKVQQSSLRQIVDALEAL